MPTLSEFIVNSFVHRKTLIVGDILQILPILHTVPSFYISSSGVVASQFTQGALFRTDVPEGLSCQRQKRRSPNSFKKGCLASLHGTSTCTSITASHDPSANADSDPVDTVGFDLHTQLAESHWL